MAKSVEVQLEINVGMTFENFEELEKKLKHESKLKCVQFSINASRTVEAARNKIKRYLNPALKFYSVHWACIHGGRQFKSRGKGIRKTMTLRKEELCPAHIRVIISDSGNELIVSSVNYRHNHLVSEKLFKQLPHNRKLPAGIKDDAKKLLQMKVNKHMLRADLEKRLDKCITLKDLRNLQQLGREGKNNIQAVCNKIQSKFGADCHLLLDNDDVFKGLTFCTAEMISSLSAFPEFICIDATYKLLNIKAPIYIILNVDGNGESGVVAVGILIQEDKESLEWFFETFKNCNPAWKKIQNIMSDKDLTEREVIRDIFPDAQLHICIFHVLKIFQRELTCEKFKISSTVRIAILELLQELVYSKNEKEFDEILEKIKSAFPERIFAYLSENWTDIKEEWCPFLGKKVNNFMNRTNNRLEGINAKFKSICQKHSTLEQFVDDMFTTIQSLENEKNNRTANFLNKRKTTFYPPDDFRSSFFHSVTPYAFKKLETQFNFTHVSFSFNEHLQCYIVKGKKSEYNTSITSCTCYFSTSMGMPCKHIFAIRNYCNENLFQPELVTDRWKNTYFLQNCAFLHESYKDDVSGNLQSTVYVDMLPIEDHSKKLTCQEKYRKTFVKAKLIATLAADVNRTSYFHLNDVLDKIINNLQNSNYNFDIVTETNHTSDIIHIDERINEPSSEMHDNDNQIVIENNFNLDIVTDNSNVNNNQINIQHEALSYSNFDIGPVSNVLNTNNPEITDNHPAPNVSNVQSQNNYKTDILSNKRTTNLEHVKVPVFKRRGRPAGSDLTVIGVPKRRKKSELLPFAKMKVQERVNIALKWILKDDKIVINRQIELLDLLPIHQIDVKILEVNINILKKYFTKEAWEVCKNYKVSLKNIAKWLCNICNNIISSPESTIRCDFCLNWVHLQCIQESGNFTKTFKCAVCVTKA